MEINIMSAKGRPDFHPSAWAFFMELHEKYTPWQQRLAKTRKLRMQRAYYEDVKPTYSSEKIPDWKAELPKWCQDQRNQMTGPADNAELIVKMMNSGAPGVMIDLEDSTANYWGNIDQAHRNTVKTLRRTINYWKNDQEKRIDPDSKAVLWIRPRGLHMTQSIACPMSLSRATTSASLYDVAMIASQIGGPHRTRLLEKQPLCFYIPKSESAEEAEWWASLFKDIAIHKGWDEDYIKCMALLESHPLAYQAEKFIYNLRDHIVGLNLGRWDYMASLIEHNHADPKWVLPDRNSIPHDVAFFQNLRKHMVHVCHSHGIMAIGGMTALYPSRKDPELNKRALDSLKADKKNEADMGMDGAWTGHPDQNQIAIDQFPYPNQLDHFPADNMVFTEGVKEFITGEPWPPHTFKPYDLRPAIEGGKITEEGTRQCIRVSIRYRNGVLNGRGASLLDGYMEDLATDRICRLMISQRVAHLDDHTRKFVSTLFDEELQRLLDEGTEQGTEETLRKARLLTEQYIVSSFHNPL